VTHPFEPTELDWHLIIDHGVDTRLIANNRALFRERGEDEEYHEFAELNHQIMHNIPTKQNPHTHDNDETTQGDTRE
jgi:hypothetical protein